MTLPSTEEEALEQEIRRLESEGYDVFVQPRRPQVPAFLEDFAPDAIAIGQGKKIVIEVVRQSELKQRKLDQLAAKFAGQSEWELKVILVLPTSSGRTLPVQSRQTIETSIAEIQQLQAAGLLRAAFLLGWATLEAQARALIAERFARPQTPGRIVQILGEEGYLTPDETDQVRRMADTRNRLIHGDLDLQVSSDDLTMLVSILKNLGAARAELLGH
jgi:uncharacterized protein YutE (UPF0331/DUF86 family)